jgi:NADPH:quinone reductase-like Zn-dependent oxidoreductase
MINDKMMKTIVVHEFGAPEVLRIEERALPIPGPNEVLVKVKALSINPVDVKTRAGKGLAGRLRDRMPLILGWDVSGVVYTSNSDEWQVGDEVFGMVNFPGLGNAYAEYVAAPADHLALKPAGTTHEEAAAATLAALTAWQVLVHHMKVGRGSRVLIHAAAGGVGHYAVQIARQLGAHVIATASAENKDFVYGLGADEYIDYRSVRFEDATSGIDFVFDTVGGDNIVRSFDVLKSGGTLISIPTGISPEMAAMAKSRGISCRFELVYSSGSDMREIARLLDTGALKSHLYTRLPFVEMAVAHEVLERGRTVGKIVLTVQ